MSNNFHLILPNIPALYGITPTATTAATNAPASNLLTPFIGEVWRSTAVTDTEIKFTSATGYSISGAALAGLNLTAAGTVRFYGYSDEAWATGVIDSTALGTINSSGDKWQWFGTAQTCKSWKFVISDGSNPDGYFEVCNAIVGTDINPNTGAAKGYFFDDENSGAVEFAESGAPIGSQGEDSQAVSIPLNFLTLDEAQTLRDAAKLAGLRAVGWVCLDDRFSGAILHSHCGRLAMQGYPARRMRSNIASVQINGRVY